MRSQAAFCCALLIFLACSTSVACAWCEAPYEGCLHQNWKGRVVVLSVDSWAPGNNVISSPEECSRVCAGRTINGVTANAFSFCDRRDGCGQGCLNFQRGGASGCDDVQNQICMGPRAVYGYDDFGGRIVPGCIGDRYRYATCSCKRNDEVINNLPPILIDGDPNWISGLAPLRPVPQPRG